MPLTQLINPFPVFVDLDGSPLDNGYLYFGTVDLNPETNPITVYYDPALTQQASQPLRTTNGFITRNGAPTSIYANSTFSVTVRNNRSALVLYSPNAIGGQVSQNTAGIAALEAAVARTADDETITGNWTFEGSVDFATSPLFNMPSGPTAERPASPINGTLFYNTTTGQIDVYYSAAWLTFGAVIDDDTLAAESDTRVPTQGNVKAYVDSGIAAIPTISTGSYNPTIIPSTSGTITANPVDIFSWSRIGDFVTVSGRVRVTAVSSPVGVPEISMPFEAFTRALSVVFLDDDSGTISDFYPYRIIEGDTKITAGFGATINAADIVAGDTFYVSISYPAVSL